MLPIGLELLGEPSVPAMMAIARQAEELGYDSIWLTETRFTRDAVTTAAAVAAATRRVRVATGVTNPYTRGAVLTAVTAATLDELAGGRFILGIGPGSPTVLARQGIAFDRPLARLRETVEVVRRLVRGDEVRFGDDAATGARLDFIPVRPAIPIYLGVTGPRALALAGEIADGVILNGFVSVAYTSRAVEIVREAAQAAGRDPDAIEIAASIVVAVAEDGREARDATRPLVAIYLAEFPNIARESGVPAELLAQIAAVHRRDGSVAAARLIDDGIVDDLVCAGTIGEVREALHRRREAGVQLPMISLAQSGMVSWLGALAETGSG
jgi:5,10-methylenetetrahydromethanopterin reductase